VVAALEAARDAKAPIILQASQGGAAYFAGKGVDNKDQFASIQGAVAAAHYIRAIAPAYGIPVVLHTDHCAKKLLPWLDGMLDADEAYFKEHGEPLFSSHMIDLSEEAVDWNIETTAKYLKRAAPMKQWLEMEIGITGGEEDGVNNEDVDNNSLYTQPEDIYEIYKTLSPISPYFSIAAGFGNVHGVYKPGNVKLHPELLQKHQAYVSSFWPFDNVTDIFLSIATLRRRLAPTRRSPSTSSSTVAPAPPSRSTRTPSHMVSSRSTSTPICSGHTSPVSATTFSTRRTTSPARLATQTVRTSQTRSTTTRVSGCVRVRRP
jgi:ketose-bisphosphate aldolase